MGAFVGVIRTMAAPHSRLGLSPRDARCGIRCFFPYREKNNGEAGIRTREPPCGSYTPSKRALSTAQTPLHCNWCRRPWHSVNFLCFALQWYMVGGASQQRSASPERHRCCEAPPECLASKGRSRTERERFELSRVLRPCRFSRAVLSTGLSHLS